MQQFRWTFALFMAAALLLIPLTTFAQDVVDDEPVIGENSLSAIEMVEQMEAADQARKDYDMEWNQHAEPYSIEGIIVLNHQVFLPTVAGSSTAVAAASENTEVLRSPLLPEGDYLTADDVAELEASQAAAAAYVEGVYKEAVGEIFAADTNATAQYVPYRIRTVSGISSSSTHKERQNDPRTFNYCGPATIKVVLDATIPKSALPWHDHIASALEENNVAEQDKQYESNWISAPGHEGPDPGFVQEFGTSGFAMCKYLYNYYVDELPFGKRYNQGASGRGQQGLWNEVVRHVDLNYTVPTGTHTNHLPGWTRGASHINAIIGYDADFPNGQPLAMQGVRYTETAGVSQGYTGGQFMIWRTPGQFFAAVAVNNVQCVLDASLQP